MATPTGLTTRYAVNAAIREDLEDIIYDISPMDTWFMNNVERSKANSTLHEWQTDSLAAASTANAAIEGDDMSAAAMTDSTRLKNYTQISRKEIVISGTLDAVKKAGKDTETAYQVMKAGKELKRDIEKMALHNNGATAGGAASARVSAGVENWLYTTRHVKTASQTTATTTAPASGIANNNPNDGTATALTAADLTTALQVPWTSGGDTNAIVVGPTLKAKIATFTGLATRFRDVASRQQAQIINAVDVFVSDFGDHNIILSRYIRSTTVLLLDTSMWAIAYLRPFQTIDIAKSGDSTKKLLLAEWTLVAKNPDSSSKITNLTS